MIILIDVNTCEKLGFDSVIKKTYPGLKMQNKLKSSTLIWYPTWLYYTWKFKVDFFIDLEK